MDSVEAFLENIEPEQRRADSKQLVQLMQSVTGLEPALWPGKIIGFGTHHYKYESGREGDTVAVGFAPRKDAIVLYAMLFYAENVGSVEKLGKVKTGKGCIYIKSLADIDMDMLSDMIRIAYTARHNVA